MLATEERECASTMISPFRAQLHAGRLQADAGGVRRAAGGIHDLARHRPCVPSFKRRLCSPSSPCRWSAISALQTHVDTALEQLRGQAVAQLLVEAAQDLRAAVEKRGVDAEGR